MADNSQAQIELLMNLLEAEREAHKKTLTLLKKSTVAVTNVLDQNRQLHQNLNAMIALYGQEMGKRILAEQALERATNSDLSHA